MTLKTPSFWYRKTNSPAPALERILTPLSYLYNLGHTINQAVKSPRKAKVPVICIGNAVAGGSGKTPTAIAIAGLLTLNNPYFLSRGYGGSLTDPTLINQDMTASECGDEALLLSRKGKTVISRDRVQGADFCAQAGADVIILDDGLQNASLQKDLSFMVIDGSAGFGNGRLLPAGPLREKLETSFAKTDAFILIGSDARGINNILPLDKPLFQAHIKPHIPEGLDLTKPIIAFAGLGRPEKFYHMLQALGANIVGWHPFPDHHPYMPQDVEKLVQEAKSKNAQLVTTEKDAVRLLSTKVFTIPIVLEFENPDSIAQFMTSHLRGTP